MSLVPKGVAVRIKRSPRMWDHSFEEGDIAVSLSEDFEFHHRGPWSLFRNQDGETQYLLPEHYEVLESPVATSPVDLVESAVKLEKAKAVYAVVDANDDVKATTADRDLARDFKAALGGKRKGIRIFQYSNSKEIR